MGECGGDGNIGGCIVDDYDVSMVMETVAMILLTKML